MGPHRYEVGELIARGGMAAVYRATDLVTRGHVAIKRLLDTGDRQSVAMFQREFHVLRELRHPRIIEVYEYGVDEQGPYYSMELLDGEDLRRRVGKSKGGPVLERCSEATWVGGRGG